MTPSHPNVSGIVLLPPGALATWAEAWIHRAVDATGSAVRIIRLQFTEPFPDFEAMASERAEERVLLLADYPSTDLLALIANSEIPVVCFVDPPHSAIRHIMTAHAVSLVEALRRYTASATVFPLLAGRNALIVRRSDGALASEIVELVLQYLRLDCGQSDAEFWASGQAIVRSGAVDLESVLREEVQPFTPAVPADWEEKDHRVVASVTDAIFGALDGRLDQPIVWPRDVLSWGGHPDEDAPPAIDLAGPNRVLYHGPYFYLPAGTYYLKAHVGFSEAAIGHPFALELHGASCIARADFSPAFGGWCFAGLEFLHRVATERVEVHLTSMRGALRGRVALNDVTIIPA